LVKAGAYDALLAEVCRQIEHHGLKVKEAAAAIIDATLIESAAQPRTHVELPAEDRAESENPEEPAHVGESPQFETMIEGSKAQRVLADKAYASKANRDSLKGKYRDGILHKAVLGRPLRQSEKRFNKLISKHRFRIEQCFGTMKRLFGLHQAQYFEVTKIHAQMVMAALSQTLLKAANKII
jgi:IS5 family transposase